MSRSYLRARAAAAKHRISVLCNLRAEPFERRLDDFGVSSLPQATERAFLDCQSEEDALYTTAVASAPGNTQALALVRAAVEQLKANLKAELLAASPEMPAKE